MKRVQNYGNLVVQELPYCLKYQSFGSLVPDADCYLLFVVILNVVLSSVVAPLKLVASSFLFFF
jgi:hypothetical protein